MKQIFIVCAMCLFLSGCGTDDAPAVSRVSPAAGAAPPSLNYQGFRSYVSARAQKGDDWASDIMSQEYGESSRSLQKKFMALDRNNDGRLSDSEINP